MPQVERATEHFSIQKKHKVVGTEDEFKNSNGMFSID
jgi:hypothetical protein